MGIRNKKLKGHIEMEDEASEKQGHGEKVGGRKGKENDE